MLKSDVSNFITEKIRGVFPGCATKRNSGAGFDFTTPEN